MQRKEDGLLRGNVSHKKREERIKKYWALIIVGILTLAYSVIEIVLGLLVDSLTLLSDGFHNFSDVIALVIAGVALMKSTGGRSEYMTYGWKRMEILGAVMNGCFLLALCLYILLESITRFITPKSIDGSMWFIGVAAAGLGVNTIGTIVFAVLGGGHHGHSHAGGGGHGHSHGTKKSKHGHGHHAAEGYQSVSTEKLGDHGHSHGAGQHGHNGTKKKKHGHGHGDNKHGHGGKHGHDHDDNHDHDDDHGHGNKHAHDQRQVEVIPPPHVFGHNEHSSLELKTPTSLNSTGYVIMHEDEDSHDEAHGSETDLNIQAVFLHYLGDALSSLCVLATGLLAHFFPDATWATYLDPVASLVVVALVLFTTIPLVKNCSQILLQQAPNQIDMPTLVEKIRAIPGIHNVHDVHVWELVDGLVIATLHVTIDYTDITTSEAITESTRKIFHKAGIHSCTIQTEYIKQQSSLECEQNCAKNCKADWCCKDERKEVENRYDTFV